MARNGMIEVHGTVDNIQGGGLYDVVLAEDFGNRRIRAKLSGKLMRHKIKVLPGDRVTVEVAPSDPSLGLITYRG